MSKVEFITPAPPLKAKTGDGGLDTSILQQADTVASQICSDLDITIQNNLANLKNFLNSKQIIENPQEESRDDLLFHLLPVKIDSTSYKNRPLFILSSQLLDFIESLDAMNVDAYHIIRAHVNAMNLIFERDICDETHKFSKALLSELEDSRVRFNKKYTFHEQDPPSHEGEHAQKAN